MLLYLFKKEIGKDSIIKRYIIQFIIIAIEFNHLRIIYL